MPRGNALPTPASSTDIKGCDGSHLSTLQLAFELPPPAVADAPQQPTSSSSSSSSSSSKNSFPTQASETVKSRKRPSTTTTQPEQFTLPPPPTRSRKIIQMKPREEQPRPSASAAKTAAKNSTASVQTPAVTGVKKKQPSATSAAGRKIARKTAHSLIERRRRSKMNEEFGVLKSLIPACSGEMHKLAILQASIEYVRYLEDCIKTLKEQTAGKQLPSPSGGEPYNPDRNFVFSGGGLSPDDVEMTSSSLEASPAITPNASRFQPPSMSPALLPEQAYAAGHDSSSSVSRHHSFSTSATTSPAFGPQVYGGSYPQSVHSASGSALTSPALPPLRDIDQEATAALLMLNQTDRRGNGSSLSAVRGMSVRDLLSA
ncbi:hypothetical protein B0T14DRAFT_417713 [Immersiella caudata]|uniref:BHLH domain-containing protein n=1 Tax=Immersiella caudata TaxID=314043 RepID=A0AA39XGI0_9PEZI|nr:hypothetical protein B0T14DRAFT_417713 [Immersiella caudata]